jgi:hypothetical protein
VSLKRTRQFGLSETLIEGWSIARRVFGDEVAQEAVVKTLSREHKELNEVSFFLTTCRWLRLHGYNDGTGWRRSDRRTEHLAKAPTVFLSHGVNRVTPELLLMWKEQAHSVGEDSVKVISEGYETRSDPTVCGKGHKGEVYFRYRTNGRPLRSCRVCSRESLREWRAGQKQES